MSLHCQKQRRSGIQPNQTGEAGTGQMVVRKGYGNECSLMIATRKPGLSYQAASARVRTDQLRSRRRDLVFCQRQRFSL